MRKSYANGNGECAAGGPWIPLWLRGQEEYAEWRATQMHWAALV